MKNRLSRKTREQFEELLEAVYQEGLEEGKASVDKFGFKTEKRVAKVGERFIVTKPSFTFGDYKKGDVFTVLEHFGDGVIAKELREKLGEDEPYICHGEYEVIIELESPQYETGKRRAMSGERVLIVNAKPLITQYKNGDVFTVTEVSDSDVDVEENDNICLFHEEYEVIIEPEQAPVIEEFPDELTPNEQRADLLQRAKQFIRSLQNRDGYFSLPTQKGIDIDVFASFKVDKENRIVTCTLKNRYQNHFCKRETARCHPNDVFNDRLGKLISLSMCLGLVVPQEFMNAVQPDSPVVGMTLSVANGRNEMKLTSNSPSPLYPTEKIIDDTNAKYGENE